MSEAPRAILEIRWGPLAGKRALIAKGSALKVGRAAPSDVHVPHDRQMSGVHFELSWDGARCRLLHQGSDQGTWLNGEQVSEGDVTSGAWIRAGDTVFMVYLEGATESARPEEAPEVTARKERALEALRAEQEPLFALLDAARSERVLTLLRESVEEYQSLYEGLEAEPLIEVAPYLVSLPRESRLLTRLVREGWGESFGVYLTSGRPFKEVRRHFRRLLLVEAETERQRLYFRFYDPRVLRVFLPSCNARQTGELLGAIGCFLLEGERGEMLRFSANQAGTAIDRAVLG